MDLIQYDPIDLEDFSFRLLRLFKGTYGPIQCELFHAQLHTRENTIEYEALSYTWGSPNKLHEIEINGKRLPVTKNLFEALQHLRNQYQDRILWIDAICIDQSNTEERGHQVRQMSSIYEKAEQVIVWLGQATPDTDMFFFYMHCLEKEAFNHACIDWKSSDGRWQLLWSNVKLLWNNVHEDVQCEGLKNLLSRAWFRRVWILQEVANARSAKIMCGAKSVSARIFTVAPTVLGITPDPHCQAVLDIMPGSSRRYSWWSGKRDLRTLLLKFKDSEATDPRDKIYALLGILSNEVHEVLLFPDYNKTEENVVHDTVAFLLHLAKQRGSMDTMPRWNCREFVENLASLEGTVLLWAADNGKEAIARMMLSTGKVPLDMQDQYDQKALSKAVLFGDEVVIERLLRTSNVDVNSEGAYGHTPLTQAAEHGSTTIVKLLLASDKVEVNLTHEYGQTPLSCAAGKGHEAVVKLLLNTSKINVDSKDNRKRTPLTLAASNGHKTVVKLLLETGQVDVDSRDKDGQTPVSWAAENGHKEVVKLLLGKGKADIDLEDHSGKTPLSRAARNGYQDIVDLLETRQVEAEVGSKRAPGHVLSSWKLMKKQSVLKLLRRTGKTNSVEPEG
jgi:ankyrin repeat protein